MIHISAKHQVVAVPTEPKLVTLFPDAKHVTHEGNDLIVLPHEAATTILLRNMGIDVPAPVTGQYDWEGGKPFDVQVKTVALLTTHQRAYVLNGMGTGKTKAALWAWRFLNRQGQANKLLVVAPLSTLTITRQREIVHTLPGIRAVVLHGDRAKRTKLLASDADINIGGSGTVEFTSFNGQTLGINIGGSGTVRGSGTAKELEVLIGGAGEIDMPGLKADQAEITIGGSGDVAFASDGTVEANIGGAGDVKVAGNAKCTVNAMGSGTLTCTPGTAGGASATIPAPPPAPAAPAAPAE